MAYNTSWTVTTYDSADNIQPGHWYSVRNKKEDRVRSKKRVK